MPCSHAAPYFYQNEGCISNSCVDKKCWSGSSPPPSPSSTHAASTSTTKPASTSATSTTKQTSSPVPSSSSSSSTIKSSSSSSSSSAKASPTLNCTPLANFQNLAIINVPDADLNGAPPEAFPTPYITFAGVKDSSGDSVLSREYNNTFLFKSWLKILPSPAVARNANHIAVNIYDCKSAYMGYQDYTSGDASFYYGQVRVPSLNNDCLTAVSPSES
jgi:hypothetical protein